MVFQSYALYPRMTVEREPVLRPAGSPSLPKAEIAARVGRAAALLQLGDLLRRRPSELSGGQRQRVAIGRALVRNVDVFLFDEPLSNLDAKLRNELRVEIKKLHQELGNTMIYVTHDQIEALTLADRIAVMKGGVIQQLATPAGDLPPAGQPVRRRLHRLADDELPAGHAGADGRSGPGRTGGSTRWPSPAMPSPAPHRPRDRSCSASGRSISRSARRPGGSHQARARVDIVEPMGADTIVWTRIADRPITIRVDGETPVAVGQEIAFHFDVARASLFDAATGIRL